tara:strand:- start:42 stop:560 length:519 start_codon:yes stop_codon:yes gene_type:complete
MGKTTFSGPVKSLAGFNPSGYNNEVNVADASATLSLTDADHGGRVVVIQDADIAITLPSIVTTEPSDKADPNQTCTLGLTFKIYFSVAASGATVTTASADNYVGALNIMKETAGANTSFFADGDDDIITLDGTTKGGLEGSYIELVCTTDGWLCSGSALLGSGTLASPFSAA